MGGSARAASGIFEPEQRGGEGGIRTLGAFDRTLVFETSQFNHSCTSPRQIILSDSII
jgi:hypothetical protein